MTRTKTVPKNEKILCGCDHKKNWDNNQQKKRRKKLLTTKKEKK